MVRWLPGLRPADPLGRLGRGTSYNCGKTATTSRGLLEDEGHLWTFLGAWTIEPTNNAAGGCCVRRDLAAHR